MAIRILINLARFAVTYLVATVVVFLFMRLIPGDPAQIALGVNATPELLEQTRKEFGTDRPLIVQYFDWAGGLLRGDFGVSYVTRTDISPLVADRLQVSLILVIAAMIVALAIAIPLGTWAAVKHRNLSGVLIGAGSQLGVAIPGFLAAILLVLIFAVGLGWLPASGWTPPGEDFGDFLRRLILPVLALASVQGAILTRYVRSAVLEIMSEDYLRTARAKGLSKMGALVKHGLRNAAIPVITVTGVQIAALIIGAVVIERVFVIPGLGSMLLDAVGNRDLLTVQSVVMVLVAITLVLNLVVDVLYTIVDPRMRKSA
ncbi:ABC transporter permease [Leucobacter luti]|uniref:Peptide/nickel transport system permease protein n=1 Tax=Leucobacter luti TaxID=340320 RepID=A0A4R6RWJ9_9MICO|nr:ABC transporter permease [Leucobacter luti]MCW2288162.1 peptide/nickel transport system permease protein [Leucobacter luti]QYM75863.1 ABC transporter permease [Leucobacter luti]TCK45676.1 peptide/nickel transport system permease protein [Leucobacter luti]TDP91422.1 peptide/nickel transport system permease protein [Leucobacter luti]